MLQSALDTQDAFERLAKLDGDYKMLPTKEQWEKGRHICDCLKVFYDITLRLSGTKYSTANYYFNDVCLIHYKLLEWRMSDVDYISEMGLLMQRKFDKYWDACNLVVFWISS